MVAPWWWHRGGTVVALGTRVLGAGILGVTLAATASPNPRVPPFLAGSGPSPKVAACPLRPTPGCRGSQPGRKGRGDGKGGGIGGWQLLEVPPSSPSLSPASAQGHCGSSGPPRQLRAPPAPVLSLPLCGAAAPRAMTLGDAALRMLPTPPLGGPPPPPALLPAASRPPDLQQGGPLVPEPFLGARSP